MTVEELMLALDKMPADAEVMIETDTEVVELVGIRCKNYNFDIKFVILKTHEDIEG